MKLIIPLGILSFAFFAYGQQKDVVQDAHLYTKPSSNIFVKFTQSLDGIYSRINRRTYSNRGEKITALTSSLKSSTQRWHQPALDGLQRFGVQGKSFWISNEIYVKGASPLVVAYLSGLSGVQSIREEQEFPVQRPQTVSRPSAPPNGEPWGVPRVRAPEVWELQDGTKGEGIIIGVIDTGVRATHEALTDTWVGLEEYGWFDGTDDRSPTPIDENGHGSHVTGICAGTMGIGVAPGARWMHCRAGGESLPQSALLACGQFMLCPHDVNGNNPDCSKGPHVISNSWGGGQNSTWYNDVIKAWNDAGKIAVYSLMNTGPNCGTHQSPADQPGVISVGNLDINETIYYQSARGPPGGPDGERSLPAISAPGSSILSSYNSADDGYAHYWGTSQACPHVTGTIALLLSRNPDLTRQEVEELLFKNTFRGLRSSGYPQCGRVPEGQYPNNVQGWGRLDALASYQALLRQE